MKPLDPTPTIKMYMLVKQTGLYISPAGMYNGNSGMNTGFYASQHEAELCRTAELLKMPHSSTDLFHIFELEFPNPAYK